jgi:transcriptional regulator GlxA family with amidase domain
MPARKATTIAVLICQNAPLFETSIPIGIFAVDRSAAGVPRFEVLPFRVGQDRQPLRTSAGLTIETPHGIEALERAGTVIVPTWSDPNLAPDPELLNGLRAAGAAGARIVGLCLGSFVLAAAGLLDGRRATTHWLCTAAMAERYPRIQVLSDVLYVEDGPVLTSAGSAAGIDACLQLIRRDHGAGVAGTVARRMVVPPHRAGGQAQYVATALETESISGQQGSPVLEAAAWVLTQLHNPCRVDDLAARAHLSRRSFDRDFRKLTGTSPLTWLNHQRVLRAQQLLENSALSVDAVARAVGFGNAVTLRQHFRSQIGVAPQAYRAAFQTTADSLPAQ